MNHRAFRSLFREFNAPSWRAWNAIEDVIHGQSPPDEDLALVSQLVGPRSLPSRPVGEFWAVKARGGGGSRFAGRSGCYYAAGRRHTVAPGEHRYVGIFAPDRKQAGITFGYVRGLLRSVPALRALIVGETKESIELSNGIIIEVLTASAAAPRGRAYVLVIVEEAAFLPTDSSADPDVELIRAVRPALARVPDSLLMVISSPYAMRGALYETWKAKFGVDDPDVLVLQGDTLTLNPTFSRREIERAYRDDPVAAEAEYGAKFRTDVRALLAREAIAAVVSEGVRELAPRSGVEVCGHVDAATGSGKDRFAVAGAFVGAPAELAFTRYWTPPFDPSAVASEAAALFRRFGISSVTVDAFAPGLVADLFRRFGIECRPAVGDTSQAFLGLLTLINARGCRLLDEPMLLHELSRLERRTALGGRDRVGHPEGEHDDVGAAAAFALVAAAHEAETPPLMLMNTERWDAFVAERSAITLPPTLELDDDEYTALPEDIKALYEWREEA